MLKFIRSQTLKVLTCEPFGLWTSHLGDRHVVLISSVHLDVKVRVGPLFGLLLPLVHLHALPFAMSSVLVQQLPGLPLVRWSDDRDFVLQAGASGSLQCRHSVNTKSFLN